MDSSASDSGTIPIEERYGVESAAATIEQVLPDEDEDDVAAGATTEEERTEDEDPAGQAEEPDSEEEEESVPEGSEEDESGDTEDEPDAEEEPAETLYEVNAAGESHQVTLQELKAGYSRHEDYSRKTAALAEQQGTAEAEAGSMREQRDRYAELLGVLQTQLDQGAVEPDWEDLRARDPAGYARAYTDWTREKDKREKVQREAGRVQGEQQQEADRFYEQTLRSERAKLVEAIPGWSDAETANAERERLIDYGHTIGFSQQELDNAVDHRSIVILRKAMLYDQAKAEGGKVMAEKRKPAPVAKPGAAKSRKAKKSSAEKAMDRLKRSGKQDDATDVFYHMLDDEEP